MGRVELLINHDPSNGVVARQADGSLIVSQDATGLWIEATLNDTLVADDALSLVRGAGYRAASVGMTNAVSDWSTVDGMRHRRIASSGLREVSLCSRGAHLSARIAAGRLPIDALRREGRLAHLAAAEATIASRRAA